MAKLTFRRFIVVFTLCALIVLGVAIGIIEIGHLRDKTHPFSWVPFAWAAAFAIVPALILDTTGTVARGLDRVVGYAREGRRSTDSVVPIIAKEPEENAKG